MAYKKVVDGPEFNAHEQQWAMLWAVRLDHQVNSTDRQTKIRTLQADCLAVLNSSIEQS